MRGLPDVSWDPARPDIEALLTSGRVVDGGMIASSSNYVFLVELAADGVPEPGYAVYKPEKGETPLWDFPPSLYKREVATYLISRALGWELVPPTVERAEGLEHGVGSLQAFIPGDQSCTYFDLRADHAETMRRFAAFDWLTNNADRMGGHIIQAHNGHLWGIDHGLTLHVEEKLRTVIWDYAGERLPDDWLDDITRLLGDLEEGASLHADLSQHLSADEMAMLRERATAILRDPVLPSPPDWRRPYPWPLI